MGHKYPKFWYYYDEIVGEAKEAFENWKLIEYIENMENQTFQSFFKEWWSVIKVLWYKDHTPW